MSHQIGVDMSTSIELQKIQKLEKQPWGPTEFLNVMKELKRVSKLYTSYKLGPRS